MGSPDVPWTLSREEFNLERVIKLKAETTVAVVVPARNESATVGAVLDAVLVHRELVDELIVVNDNSVDDTSTVADHHGARVVRFDGPSGKGEAMRAGLSATTSELVVFLDADVMNTTSEFVARLIQPLLERPEQTVGIDYSASGVAYLHRHALLAGPCDHRQFALLLIQHRSLAVLDEIKEHLQQALPVRPDRRKIRIDFPPHVDPSLTKRRLHDYAQFLQQ